MHIPYTRRTGKSPRRDLFEAIQSGKFPEWDLAVQLFTENDAETYPFDLLDPTNLIPEELVPLVVIGKMVLDRWPDNFFAETEQVTFCPPHLLPDMDFSNDPFLYRDGHMQMDTPKGRVAHEPSSLDPKSALASSSGFRSFAEPAGDDSKGSRQAAISGRCRCRFRSVRPGSFEGHCQ